MKFRLIRNFPHRIEIEVLPAQIVSMFPVEVQVHPVFGQLRRTWKTENTEYCVENFNQEQVQVVATGKHIKLKDDIMLSILQQIDRFQIVLYYSDKQDIYDVVKL